MSPEVRAARRRLALRAIGGGLAWSVGVLLTALVAPLYDGQTSSDANGLTLSTATCVQRNGAWVLIPLLAPLIAGVIAAVAVTRPAPSMRRAALGAAAAIAVLGLVLVTSGGIVFLPVALLLGIALRLTRPTAPGRRPAGGPDATRASGPDATRAGGPDATRAGGPDVTRVGGGGSRPARSRRSRGSAPRTES